MLLVSLSASLTSTLAVLKMNGKPVLTQEEDEDVTLKDRTKTSA